MINEKYGFYLKKDLTEQSSRELAKHGHGLEFTTLNIPPMRIWTKNSEKFMIHGKVAVASLALLLKSAMRRGLPKHCADLLNLEQARR